MLLTQAEARVRRAVCGGQPADPRQEIANHEETSLENEEGARPIRAELLIELLTKDAPQGMALVRRIEIRSARITGFFDLRSASLKYPLILRGCSLEAPMDLRGARGPALLLSGCDLPGLIGDALEINANLELNNVTVRGQLQLNGAHVGGSLDCTGSQFGRSGSNVSDVRAIDAYRITVGQDVRCKDGFLALGEVHFGGARIGGTFSCSGGQFKNPSGRAISAYGVTVEQDVMLTEGRDRDSRPQSFSAKGSVHLVGARIGGSLNCTGGQFAGPDAENAEARAIDAYRIIVGKDVMCKNGFAAYRSVHLVGADIGGEFNCTDGTFSSPGGLALNLARMRASGLVLLPNGKPLGGINLNNVDVDTFDDDPKAWPEPFHCRGFVNRMLRDDHRGVKYRCRALQYLPYGPQPYEQLAVVYRRMGDDRAARHVMIAKHWQGRRMQGTVGKIWNWLLYFTVGYGYRPWLAGLWLLALVAIASHPLDLANEEQLLSAAKDKASQQPTFHSVIYSLDLLLPVVTLGQDTAWIPRGWATLWVWGLTIAGWILTTAVVAGLTGIVRRT